MEIAVDGWRAGAAEWDAVKNLPPEQIPALSHEQREVARKFGISELEYARSAEAGRRSQERLLEKTERLARVLLKMLRDMNVAATVNNVTLRTFQEKFDVALRIGSHPIQLRIAEGVVDDLFEAGSEDAEQRLGRILRTAVEGRVREQ